MILYIPAEGENRSLDQIWMKTIEMTHVMFKGFPCSSDDKAPNCNAGDLGSIPGLGRSPGKRKTFWPSIEYYACILLCWGLNYVPPKFTC